MLVAPELYLVGYCACAADAERIAGPQHGPGAQALSELAAECRIAIVTGYAERYGSRIYKAACAFGPDGNALAQFRKLHVPVNFERSAFATGNRLVCFDWLGVRFGLLICYDLEFPEPIRALARLVVQVILVPTALSANWTRLTTTLVPTRAFENGLFVAYVNHARSDHGTLLCSGSAIVDPLGFDVARAGTGEELIIGSLDLGLIAKARARLPYLSDLNHEALAEARA